MTRRTVLLLITLCLLPVPRLIMRLRVSLHNPVYPISPAGNTQFRFRAYTDTSEGGTSQGRLSIKDDSLNFTFTLRKGYSKPFAGFAVEPLSPNATIDLSGYDSLAFTVRKSCADTQDIKINIHTPFEKNTTVKPLRIRINEKIEPCLLMTSTICVALDDFAPPGWWCEKCKVSCGSLRRETYRRVAALIFQNGDTTPRDQEITFSISAVSFRKNSGGRARAALLGVLLYYLCIIAGYVVWIGIKWMKRKPAISSSSVPESPGLHYKPLEVANALEEEELRVERYFGEHFQNPDLTLETAAREIGMNQKKLSQTLNKTFKYSFRQYLNNIRIEEAKRLLRETDRQVAEIARMVGYQTVAHFNRTFRQMAGCSPNEYRSEHGVK